MLVSKRALWAALALGPWVYCIALTAKYGFDAPFWDEWWQLPTIQKSFDGTLVAGDLWGQVNEHRIFFPMVLTVGLARATHWNLAWELGAILVFQSLTFLLLVTMVLRAEKGCGVRGNLWVLPLASLMMFSFNQWGIWLWGLHLALAMAAFLMVASVLVLSVRPLRWFTFAAGCALAVMASYSAGPGVATWAAGMVLLAHNAASAKNAASDRKAGILWAVLWPVCAAAAMTVYFIGYAAPSPSESALEALRSPVAYVAYVLTYMGSPLFNYSAPCALIAGVIGFLYSIRVTQRLLGTEGVDANTQLPFWGLTALAWSCAALTGLKQSHEGIGQALSSRYILWPTLFWIALIGQGYILSLSRSRGDAAGHPIRRAIIPALLGLLALVGSAYGSYRADERHDAFLLGRRALVTGEHEEDLKWLYPDIEIPKQGREVLVQYRLTVFRD